MPKLSALSLAPVRRGQDYQQAVASMVRLAQELENLGYSRFWIAEHHNMPSLASSATQLLIMHTLANTHSIRVGSGGVMLPNHSPLTVAEQYGTLATLYPDRVDLGLGRAPGTDQPTAAALRRRQPHVQHEFPNDVRELQGYFGAEEGQGYVRAFPGIGLGVPLYILGSSTESAYLAASLGLPYAFAAHFAPRMMEAALAIYRRGFKPSVVSDAPYVIVALNAALADTDEEARRLFTTTEQFALNVVRGTHFPVPPPVESMAGLWTPDEEAYVRQFTSCAIVGSAHSAAAQLEDLQTRLRADELMVTGYIFDEAAQYRSYKMLKEIADAA